MGMPDEAVAKWKLALELAPDHKDAPAYLQMAQREREAEQRRVPAAPTPTPAAHAPAPSAPSPEIRLDQPEAAVDSRESRIVQAEHLLQQQHLQEALQGFQELLDLEPEDPRILRGYHHARALLGARDEPSTALAVTPARSLPAPVGPPTVVTAQSATRRGGFNPPGARKGLALPGWFRTPGSQAAVLGILVCLAVGLALYGVHRREAALKDAVATAKRNALKPIARMVEVPSLAETVPAIREEAEGTLGDDPLLAYFRAEEWQRRDPDDPAAAELQRQAKDRLAHLAVAGSLADFDKAVQLGDLEGARRCVLGLLSRTPDDQDLRARARKVALALVVQYATKDRMPEAAETLRLGRAMFPQDPSWQAKLKLLESIQAMAKSDRTPWIQLLG
jgi:tetratricopeptide (TPR) repeat protein